MSKKISWAGFRNDRHGGFAVAFAVAAPVVALAVGAALNITQLVHTRSSLQNAIDAAVTSTARELTLGRIKEKDVSATVAAFLRANTTASLARGDTIVLKKVSVDKNAKTCLRFRCRRTSIFADFRITSNC